MKKLQKKDLTWLIPMPVLSYMIARLIANTDTGERLFIILYLEILLIYLILASLEIIINRAIQRSDKTLLKCILSLTECIVFLAVTVTTISSFTNVPVYETIKQIGYLGWFIILIIAAVIIFANLLMKNREQE